MHVPEIVFLDHGTGIDGRELQRFLGVLDTHLYSHLFPAWHLYAVPWLAGKGENVRKDVPRIHLWQHPQHARDVGALGRHGAEEGCPEGHVFVDVCHLRGSPWTRVASHEVIELLGNPHLNLEVFHEGAFWPRELCDPVQGVAYELKGTPLSDFVLPSWFLPGSPGPYSFCSAVPSPFFLHPSGYVSTRRLVGGTLVATDRYGGT